jgi:3D (Asp-Asp-Asp) domain-containing protein
MTILGLILFSGCATLKQPDIRDMNHSELVEMASAIEAGRGKKVFSAVGPDGRLYISSRPIHLETPEPEPESETKSQKDFSLWARENIFGVFEMEVTAYYGPLPNQKKYATGSYEEDIKLNGKGVMTSGGVDVRKHFRESPGIGIAAADKKFLSRGSTVFVPGYGLALVCDTGSPRTIIDNRLDIFMGWGDEGLAKACQWGRRRVRVYEIKENGRKG